MAVETASPTAGGAADIYAALGVQPFINASGHNTAQGGSLMPAEVLAAMEQAARHYVSLRALQDAAGRRIAEVVGAPAALVSSGAAAAILLGAAACLTGKDEAAVQALPETAAHGRNRILVCRAPRPNYMYQACQAAGGKLWELGQAGAPISPADFREAMEAAAGSVAGVLLILAAVDQAQTDAGGWEACIGQIAAHAAAHGVPVLVDAASELPPRNLIRRLLDLGATAVIVSGGKAIRGPQASGLLLGSPDLIEAAALNNNPLAAIGRPLKVGKEELCGLVAAVERFFAMDEDAQLAEWRETCERIVAAGSGGPSAEVISGHPGLGRPPLVPKAVFRFDDQAGAARAADALRHGQPPIQPLLAGPHLIFNPMTIEPGEAEIVAQRVRQLFAPS
jgi:D-glucosaminate-6-phosphate ammonia-lyase